MRVRRLVGIVLFGALFSCGAGPYGHSVVYSPTSDESRASRGAREFDPVMVERELESWRKSPISLFGVVKGRTLSSNRAVYVTLSVRRLEPRNLCQSALDEDTCRVTVSDREFGVVHAMLKPTAEDDSGEHPIAPGSLVRLIGHLQEKVDPNDQGLILNAEFYRHWPLHYFATRANADTLRQ